ncbi:MAG: replication-associated recombination protein A, partial [Desulfotomaculaceae bacterium]|nr:replication-associated recombination protein A [Desulfotomaculaceae bacterium]
ALGHGKGYLYPHDYPKSYVKQNYLPDNIEGKIFYKPSDNGRELEIKSRMKHRK